AFASFGTLFDCYSENSGDRLASGCTGGFHDCCVANSGVIWPYRSDICVCSTPGTWERAKACWVEHVRQGERLGLGNAQIECAQLRAQIFRPCATAAANQAV